MQNARHCLRLVALVGLALPLGGCLAHNPAELPAPLQVDQPEICERILEPVNRPAFGPDHDAVDAFEQRDAASYVANERIKAGRACIRDQRQEYAGKGLSQ